ncbi:Sulfotransferase domain-containing protein [Aquipseudomonas alcaligenes]|uniref:sulfotransferase domain-containing protein n=1 Tax=Aquipseudomonas alcaligenes TaxID=43263 RepID=UPI000955EBFC|nr:sulfotransferase domain-containing protein [Pseudomonas alcaligenes]SIS13219.1 Sulfotransferase domain-containing protein [Pseudomonas alcaligenes]
MKIDFMVPGISKCGTTTLCYLLGEHPQLFIPAIKEPHHFNRGDMAENRASYEALFREAQAGQLLGEGSQMYSADEFGELVSARLALENPQMKLIFCVRNPLKRIESSYREFHHSGPHYAVNAPFGIDNAITELRALLADSCYWTRLQSFRKYFSDEQILVVFLEDLQKNPQQELERCYIFLGVDASYRNPSAGAQLNSRDEKLYDTRLLRLLRTNKFTGYKLAKLSIPQQDRIFTRIGLRRPFTTPLQWTPATKQMVVEHLRDDIQQLLHYCEKPADYWKEFA